MKNNIAIVGGGPSGLIAADILSANNFSVTIFDRKPTVGRKFLLAGRGGLNITHSEQQDFFVKKYGKNSQVFEKLLDSFSQNDLRNLCERLGEKTFVGSSGRVFPKSFKSSPLLRSWLTELKKQNVNFKLNHDWIGWEQDKLVFSNCGSKYIVSSDITLLALGGASWPKLGSDGSWIKILDKENIQISKIQASNCGFHIAWTDIFKQRFSGSPLKTIKLKHKNIQVRGEFIITREGVEGGIIYTLSSAIRETINEFGSAEIIIDLKPDLQIEQIKNILIKANSKSSLSTLLSKTLKLSNVAIGLIMEFKKKYKGNNFNIQKLAYYIKNYKLILGKPFPIERSISTAGGVTFESIDENFMLSNKKIHTSLVKC